MSWDRYHFGVAVSACARLGEWQQAEHVPRKHAQFVQLEFCEPVLLYFVDGEKWGWQKLNFMKTQTSITATPSLQGSAVLGKMENRCSSLGIGGFGCS